MKLKQLFNTPLLFLLLLAIILFCLFSQFFKDNKNSFKEGFKNTDGDWKEGLGVTHYYDCGGQTCDAPLLKPFDINKFVATPGYKVLDPEDFGGSVYGEKMWLYGAASDDLAKLLGSNIPGLGHPDSHSGPDFGCGRSILIKNPNAINSDWSALVMRKSQCPPGNDVCKPGKIHMDLMIPGFDDLRYSQSNICGNPGTSMCKDQSAICGSVNPKDCTSCDKLPSEFIKGCKLFVEWGWPRGDPTCQWKIVDTPQPFIDYTKSIQLGTADIPSGPKCKTPPPPSPSDKPECKADCDCSWANKDTCSNSASCGTSNQCYTTCCYQNGFDCKDYCSGGTPSQTKYSCDSQTNQCNKDPNGSYSSLSECQNNCTSKPPSSQGFCTWNPNNGCADGPGQGGAYCDESENNCLGDCKGIKWCPKSTNSNMLGQSGQYNQQFGPGGQLNPTLGPGGQLNPILGPGGQYNPNNANNPRHGHHHDHHHGHNHHNHHRHNNNNNNNNNSLSFRLGDRIGNVIADHLNNKSVHHKHNKNHANNDNNKNILNQWGTDIKNDWNSILSGGGRY